VYTIDKQTYLIYNQLNSIKISKSRVDKSETEGVFAMPLTRDVLTPQEVAEYLQLTPDTVYRYIREGRLVASKLGRQYRVPKENVELFLLATSVAGDARMRTFSRQQVMEWLEDDRIDEETRSIGQEFLEALQGESQ
jgi:excisionase family DNA binding protein